jgi:hypothetical protein
MAAIEGTNLIPRETSAQFFRGEAMTSAWVGPNAYNNLRSDQGKEAVALARAINATIGAPVMLSMELEYIGPHTHSDPSIHRQGEYNNFIGTIDELG